MVINSRETWGFGWWAWACYWYSLVRLWLILAYKDCSDQFAVVWAPGGPQHPRWGNGSSIVRRPKTVSKLSKVALLIMFFKSFSSTSKTTILITKAKSKNIQIQAFDFWLIVNCINLQQHLLAHRSLSHAKKYQSNSVQLALHIWSLCICEGIRFQRCKHAVDLPFSSLCETCVGR